MNLSPLPIQKFFSNDGAPLAGGKLFTYAAGTTTKIATYTDAGGALNTNPIILDFRGECRLWIDPDLSYKLTLAPANDTDPPGSPIWTVDNIILRVPGEDNAAADTGGANAIALAITGLPTTPITFTRIVFTAAATNTGPTTIAINGGPAKSLTWKNLEAISASAILQNGIYEAVYDGSQWQLQSPALQLPQLRSSAEIGASVVPSNFVFDSADSPGQMYRYGAAGNYTGPGVGTDDTTAFRRACLVIQQQGGGVLNLGSRRYRLFSDGSTNPLGNFSNLRGITIKSDGAELVIDRTFTGSQVIQGFQFTACSGIAFVGHIKVTCTQTQPFGEKTARGFEFASFSQGCTNVSNEVATFTAIRVGWIIRRALGDPASYISRGFRLGVTNASQVGYPLTTAGATGDSLTASLVTFQCGRSYFPQGMVNHVVNVTSTDAEASVDCLLASVGTVGPDGLDLTYTNVSSTFADNSRDCVRLEIQDSDLYDVICRNIKIKLNILTGGSTYTGFGFSVGKVKADSTPDPTDRGHRIENVEISGTIDGSNPNQRGIGFCSFGTWGTGEFVRNISFRDLRLVGIAQPTFNLASLQDRAVFSDVYCSAQMNVTGNTISTITLIGVDCAGSITTSTGDTSRMVYVGCNFGSLANQSMANKKFIGCDGLGNQYLATGTGFAGAAPTGNIDYSITGDVVTLRIANIQGTSNANTCTFTGMPVQIRPTASQLMVGRVQDNGDQKIGWLVRVETTGVLTLMDDEGVTTAFNAGAVTKGIGQQTLTYRMS